MLEASGVPKKQGSGSWQQASANASKRLASGMQALMKNIPYGGKNSKKMRPQEPVEPVVLIEPQLAKNSILRVMLLVTHTQFQNSPAHKQIAHAHAINLLNCLAETENNIDRNRLEELAMCGITDEIKGLRPLVWRILLNYLPPDASQWDDILRNNKEIYGMYLDELIVKPKINRAELEHDAPTTSMSATSDRISAACIGQQTSDPEQKTQKAQESAKQIMAGIKSLD